MLASQGLHPDDILFNPWTSWSLDFTEQESQHSLPTPSSDETKAILNHRRRGSRPSLKAVCASNTQSRAQRRIAAASRARALPVRSSSWSGHTATYNTGATAPTTNLPASFEPQHSAPAVHSEPLAYSYNFGPVAAHNVPAFPQSHQYEQATPWTYAQPALDEGNGHALWSNEGQPQHSKIAYFGDAVESESSASSFSSPLSYPSQVDRNTQQEPYQGISYPHKPIYGLFANFDSWQNHGTQVCLDNLH